MFDWFLMGLLDESSVVSLFKRGDRRFLIGSDAFLTVKFELGITSFNFLSSFILFEGLSSGSSLFFFSEG